MFKAFENGSESHAIHDLTLENDLDCVSLYGNLQITKDQEGLKAAKVLQAFAQKRRASPSIMIANSGLDRMAFVESFQARSRFGS